MQGHETRYLVGLDVGSTTVKAVVVDRQDDRIVWQDYQRHETKQPEKTLEFLRRMEAEVDVSKHNTRMFVTGSGGGAIAEAVGAKFVQEVTAVALAVEKLHPEVYSVIELGGQDAKIIVFKDDEEQRTQEKNPVDERQVCRRHRRGDRQDQCQAENSRRRTVHLGYAGVKLHQVAGKCGVFAETDINGLQKLGTPPEELMASLFDAIVLQNLSVLTRGNTLTPHVLLLGGPNCFIRGMREAWQANIPRMWEERKVGDSCRRQPRGTDQGPGKRAVFRGARVRSSSARTKKTTSGATAVPSSLEHYLEFDRARGEGQVRRRRPGAAATGTCAIPSALHAAEVLARQLFSGTSTVRRLCRRRRRIDLDQGRADGRARRQFSARPISSRTAIRSRTRLRCSRTCAPRWKTRERRLEVLGVATTGYAKDILRDVLKADVALVETVAHAESAMKFYDDPHVIVDVGGQDIKLIVVKDGRVKDFKLNTQCSAGNGYFLQSTAEGFGVSVGEYADLSFSAQEYAGVQLWLRGFSAIRHR